jgi:hypothetical protein
MKKRRLADRDLDMVRRQWFAVPLFVLLGAVPVLSQQPPSAGRIKVASGTVFLIRAGATLRAQAGQTVFEADVLRTGPDGRVGVTLKDDTRVSLGPASEVRLDRFSYAPAAGQLALALKVVHGVIAYVSGRIAKLAPDAIRIETPEAILGVRGTTLVVRVEDK